LGTIRHRARVLEYRVEQHAAILGDRLGPVEGRVAALAVVLLYAVSESTA